MKAGGRGAGEQHQRKHQCLCSILPLTRNKTKKLDWFAGMQEHASA